MLMEWNESEKPAVAEQPCGKMKTPNGAEEARFRRSASIQ